MLDDMPDKGSEIGATVLWPDMGVMELQAKSEGFPKILSLGLIMAMRKSYRNLEWQRNAADKKEGE